MSGFIGSGVGVPISTDFFAVFNDLQSGEATLDTVVAVRVLVSGDLESGLADVAGAVASSVRASGGLLSGDADVSVLVKPYIKTGAVTLEMGPITLTSDIIVTPRQYNTWAVITRLDRERDD